jgi:hypothetical protein
MRDFLKAKILLQFLAAYGTTTVSFNFQGAHTHQFQSQFSTVEGEGMPMLEAIQLAIHHRWNFVIFESDCQVLANAITSNYMGESQLALLLVLRISLRLLFNFEMMFVRIQTNMIVPSLAM